MITAILIDDEMPALTVLDYYLSLTEEITVQGKYCDPLEGVAAVAELKPQVVFLDIDMPEIKGIDAASCIMEKNPDTIIVFVTAYSEYAVQAYELSALDYLLKTISKERLDKTIARLKNSIAASRSSETCRLKINCLGDFTIAWEGKSPINWRSKKAQELVAFLIQNKGKQLSSEALIDNIWPDADQESGSHLMRNAIYYIRRALKNYGVTEKEISIQGRYCMTVKNADLDVDLFERSFERIQSKSDIESCVICADQYSGEYLPNDGWLWSVQRKAELLRNYLWVVSKTADLLIQSRDYPAAEEYLLKGLSREPYEEGMIAQLLELYRQTGEHTKATRLYKKYCAMVNRELGCSPSEEIIKKFRGS